MFSAEVDDATALERDINKIIIIIQQFTYRS